MEEVLHNMLNEIISNPISFCSDAVGCIGGVCGVVSHRAIKKIKKKLLNNDKIQKYNNEREAISTKAGALKRVRNDSEINNPILWQNEISSFIGTLEYYQDIIPDKKINKCIRELKNGKNIVGNLEKVRLICEREVFII